MRLDRLPDEVGVLEMRGDVTTEVTTVTHDSRAVVTGALFCCVRGARSDGHDHAAAAVRAGAAALLVDRFVEVASPQARVGDVRASMPWAAAAVHDHPARQLVVAGVTGTAGKTTVSHLLGAVLGEHGWSTDVIGTIGNARTTPESTDLQARLASWRDQGGRAAVIEVSSAALVSHRVDGMQFDVAVFTNLGHDHIGEVHRDIEEYFAAKAMLFEPDRALMAVVNRDDDHGRRLLAQVRIPHEPYSVDDAEDVVATADGTDFTWAGERVHLSLAGRFNLANAVGAATAARRLGVDATTIARGLSRISGVPGHMQAIDRGQPFRVLVDYAHTPDALESLLTSLRQTTPERVLVVFGCGGDRDRAKRPAMGAVAARLADVAVLTSDNPRSENAMAIIDDVLAGVDDRECLVVEPDRSAAIAQALERARPGDTVVVAGKGHETGQVLGDVTIPFDDTEVATRWLEEHG